MYNKDNNIKILLNPRVEKRLLIFIFEWIDKKNNGKKPIKNIKKYLNIHDVISNKDDLLKVDWIIKSILLRSNASKAHKTYSIFR